MYNATVEVKTLKKVYKLPANVETKEDGFYVIDKFSNDLGFAKGEIHEDFGAINKLRIVIHTPSSNWIVISEIDFSNRY